MGRSQQQWHSEVSVYKLLIFILKYIAPIGIALIFINELGFLK